MDSFPEESREERSIEDYLFSDYERPAYKSTFGLDQQFARPIEDEDVFGGLPSNLDVQHASDYRDDGSFTSQYDDIPIQDGFLADNDDGEISATAGVSTLNDDTSRKLDDIEEESSMNRLDSKMTDVDQVFVDDYSDVSDDENREECPPSTGNNERPSRFGDEQASNGQLRGLAMREKLREQVKLLGLVPQKILLPDEDGMIDVGGDAKSSQSNTSTKFMFSKFFNKSRKARDPLEGGRTTWREYKEAMLKKICADKRKIWDSFQAPCDQYDEDEEFIEERNSSPDATESQLSEIL